MRSNHMTSATLLEEVESELSKVRHSAMELPRDAAVRLCSPWQSRSAPSCRDELLARAYARTRCKDAGYRSRVEQRVRGCHEAEHAAGLLPCYCRIARTSMWLAASVQCGLLTSHMHVSWM